jgi:hypothetical protein
MDLIGRRDLAPDPVARGNRQVDLRRIDIAQLIKVERRLMRTPVLTVIPAPIVVGDA